MAGTRFERLRRLLAALRPRRRGRSGRPGEEPSAPYDADSAGYQPSLLGDLHETRRESLSRRLGALRGRSALRRRPDLGAARGRIPDLWHGLTGALAGGFDLVRDWLARAATMVADLWFELPLVARQRAAAAAGLLAVLAFGFFVLLPLAPCWAPGGDRCAPDDDAIALVPGDAAAYLHANLDPETDQGAAAAAIAGRLPSLSAGAAGLLAAAADRRLDYEADIGGWSGGELALALDANGTETSRMLMIEVADQAGAEEFERRVLGPMITESDLGGTSVETDRDGLSTAIHGGFLLIGPQALVSETVELPAGESLAVHPAAGAALDALPDEALIQAYASAELAAALARRPDLGSFDTFVNSAASEGVAAAVLADGEAIELALRSIQDPERADVDPDFFSALPLFEPKLTEQVNADALVYLGVGDPGASAATLVGQAAATAPDLFAGLKRFNRRLRGDGGVDIEADVVPLLEGEAALTVEPQETAEAGSEQTPGVIGATSVPYLALLASGVDTDGAARDLAELQVPIAESVDPSGGQSPVFGTREIEGVDAQSLRLSPVVDLTYATFDDQLIVGTSPAAVERAVSGAEPLADADSFRAVTDGFPDQVSMIGYLGFRDLLSFGERLFLAEDPAYARFAVDLRTLDAAALAVTRTRSQLATDLRVTVGEPESGDPTSSTLGSEPG